jgi:hypothetical protein
LPNVFTAAIIIVKFAPNVRWQNGTRIIGFVTSAEN